MVHKASVLTRETSLKKLYLIGKKMGSLEYITAKREETLKEMLKKNSIWKILKMTEIVFQHISYPSTEMTTTHQHFFA